ncbi:MAG: hypothetical protein NT092_07355 [Bacteroidia bacterium]|nr:hypothetical protein [Bacteroidia bacterium]
MKKKTTIPVLVALVLIAFSVSSCDKEVPLGEAIIGKWEVQTEQQIYSLLNVKKFEYTFYYEANDLAFEFTSGGGLIVYQYGEMYGMLTYTLNGNTLTIGSGTSSYEWKNVVINENNISWTETSTQLMGETTYNVEIIYTSTKK